MTPVSSIKELQQQIATYRAPRWLPGGHLQTIYPATCVALPSVAYRRERWITPDDDFVDLDFVDGQPGRPLLLLLHGLEGSSNSHYARALMAHLQTLGWSAVVLNFRGCSGAANLAPRFYHSGDAAEIDWVIRRLRQQPISQMASAVCAVGVSLGGNALLRWLGEYQPAGLIDAACAVSAPLDLSASGTALGHGFNRLYTRMFLRNLKRKAAQKLIQFPGLYDLSAVMAAANLYQFDNLVTAPLHGYRDTDDYWHRASACHVLPKIQTPTLVLNARNDPFLPATALPRSAAACVTLAYPDSGGHVGFFSRAQPVGLNWLPTCMTTYFKLICD